MNLNGRELSIEGSMRDTCRIEVDADAEVLSGGMYVPSNKKDLMFDIRSVEEADGESRIMGSGRLPGLVGFAFGIIAAPPMLAVVAALAAPGLLPCFPALR